MKLTAITPIMRTTTASFFSQGLPKSHCRAHFFKNLWHGGITLRLCRGTIASHCATAFSSKLGQRQYYGGGGCDGESERPRPGYKRPAAESGNQDVCDYSTRRHGLQIHSFASELRHD